MNISNIINHGGNMSHLIWIKYFTMKCQVKAIDVHNQTPIEHFFMSTFPYEPTSIRSVKKAIEQSTNKSELEKNLASLFHFNEINIVNVFIFARLVTNQINLFTQSPNIDLIPQYVIRGYICFSYQIQELVKQYLNKRPMTNFQNEYWELIHYPLKFLLDDNNKLFDDAIHIIQPILEAFSDFDSIFKLNENDPFRISFNSLIETILLYSTKDLILFVFILNSFLYYSNHLQPLTNYDKIVKQITFFFQLLPEISEKLDSHQIQLTLSLFENTLMSFTKLDTKINPISIEFAIHSIRCLSLFSTSIDQLTISNLANSILSFFELITKFLDFDELFEIESEYTSYKDIPNPKNLTFRDFKSSFEDNSVLTNQLTFSFKSVQVKTLLDSLSMSFSDSSSILPIISNEFFTLLSSYNHHERYFISIFIFLCLFNLDSFQLTQNIFDLNLILFPNDFSIKQDQIAIHFQEIFLKFILSYCLHKESNLQNFFRIISTIDPIKIIHFLPLFRTLLLNDSQTKFIHLFIESGIIEHIQSFLTSNINENVINEISSFYQIMVIARPIQIFSSYSFLYILHNLLMIERLQPLIAPCFRIGMRLSHSVPVKQGLQCAHDTIEQVYSVIKQATHDIKVTKLAVVLIEYMTESIQTFNVSIFDDMTGLFEEIAKLPSIYVDNDCFYKCLNFFNQFSNIFPQYLKNCLNQTIIRDFYLNSKQIEINQDIINCLISFSFDSIKIKNRSALRLLLEIANNTKFELSVLKLIIDRCSKSLFNIYECFSSDVIGFALSNCSKNDLYLSLIKLIGSNFFSLLALNEFLNTVFITKNQKLLTVLLELIENDKPLPVTSYFHFDHNGITKTVNSNLLKEPFSFITIFRINQNLPIMPILSISSLFSISINIKSISLFVNSLEFSSSFDFELFEWYKLIVVFNLNYVSIYINNQLILSQNNTKIELKNNLTIEFGISTQFDETKVNRNFSDSQIKQLSQQPTIQHDLIDHKSESNMIDTSLDLISISENDLINSNSLYQTSIHSNSDLIHANKCFNQNCFIGDFGPSFFIKSTDIETITNTYEKVNISRITTDLIFIDYLPWLNNCECESIPSCTTITQVIRFEGTFQKLLPIFLLVNYSSSIEQSQELFVICLQLLGTILSISPSLDGSFQNTGGFQLLAGFLFHIDANSFSLLALKELEKIYNILTNQQLKIQMIEQIWLNFNLWSYMSFNVQNKLYSTFLYSIIQTEIVNSVIQTISLDFILFQVQSSYSTFYLNKRQLFFFEEDQIKINKPIQLSSDEIMELKRLQWQFLIYLIINHSGPSFYFYLLMIFIYHPDHFTKLRAFDIISISLRKREKNLMIAFSMIENYEIFLDVFTKSNSIDLKVRAIASLFELGITDQFHSLTNIDFKQLILHFSDHLISEKINQISGQLTCDDIFERNALILFQNCFCFIFNISYLFGDKLKRHHELCQKGKEISNEDILIPFFILSSFIDKQILSEYSIILLKSITEKPLLHIFEYQSWPIWPLIYAVHAFSDESAKFFLSNILISSFSLANLEIIRNFMNFLDLFSFYSSIDLKSYKIGIMKHLITHVIRSKYNSQITLEIIGIAIEILLIELDCSFNSKQLEPNKIFEFISKLKESNEINDLVNSSIKVATPSNLNQNESANFQVDSTCERPNENSCNQFNELKSINLNQNEINIQQNEFTNSKVNLTDNSNNQLCNQNELNHSCIDFKINFDSVLKDPFYSIEVLTLISLVIEHEYDTNIQINQIDVKLFDLFCYIFKILDTSSVEFVKIRSQQFFGQISLSISSDILDRYTTFSTEQFELQLTQKNFEFQKSQIELNQSKNEIPNNIFKSKIGKIQNTFNSLKSEFIKMKIGKEQQNQIATINKQNQDNYNAFVDAHFKSMLLQSIHNDKLATSFIRDITTNNGPWSVINNSKPHWKATTKVDSTGHNIYFKIDRNFDDHKKASRARDTNENHEENGIKENLNFNFSVRNPKANKQGKIVSFRVTQLTLLNQINGFIYINELQILFDGSTFSKTFRDFSKIDHHHKYIEIPIENVAYAFQRRHQHFDNGIEIFTTANKSYFFVFDSKDKRQEFLDYLKKLTIIDKPKNSELFAPMQQATGCCAQTISASELVQKSRITKLWQEKKITNYVYLFYLNVCSGRSFNDISQYPIYPWILSDYTSEHIDLNDPSIYRDLSKPIGAYNQTRLSDLQLNMQMEDPLQRCLYRSFFSSPLVVTGFLIRTEPFTTLHIRLQDGKFDLPGRLFFSIKNAWSSVTGLSNDFRELIPEFFSSEQFLINSNKYDFGKMGSLVLNDVELPNWSKTPHEFISIHRMALESDYVSNHLEKWIDLIFGVYQCSKEKNNVFHVFFDTDRLPSNIYKNEDLFGIAKNHAMNFGTSPIKLFKEEHPPRSIPVRGIYRTNTNSIDLIDLAKFDSSNKLLVSKSANDLNSTFPHLDSKPILCKNGCVLTQNGSLYNIALSTISNYFSLLDLPDELFIDLSDEFFFEVSRGGTCVSVKENKTGREVGIMPHNNSVITCINCIDNKIVLIGGVDCAIDIWTLEHTTTIQVESSSPLLVPIQSMSTESMTRSIDSSGNAFTFLGTIASHMMPIVAITGKISMDLIVSIDEGSNLLITSLNNRKFIFSFKINCEPNCKHYVRLAQSGIICVSAHVPGNCESKIYFFDLCGNVLNEIQIDGSVEALETLTTKSLQEFVIVSTSNQSIFIYECESFRLVKKVTDSIIPHFLSAIGQERAIVTVKKKQKQQNLLIIEF